MTLQMFAMFDKQLSIGELNSSHLRKAAKTTYMAVNGNIQIDPEIIKSF